MPICNPKYNSEDYDPGQLSQTLEHCSSEIKHIRSMLEILFYSLSNQQETPPSEALDSFFTCVDSWLQDLDANLEALQTPNS